MKTFKRIGPRPPVGKFGLTALGLSKPARFGTIWLLLIAYMFSALPNYAQNDRGTITGTITDPSGAVVPHVPIVLTEAASGEVYRTESTETGSYTLPSLPAGKYDLTIEASGFKSFLQKGITIEVAQTSRLDVSMQIGSTADTITVSGDVPLLKSENAEQSTTITRARLNDLPLNFAGSQSIRDPLAFATLTPGVEGGGNSLRVNGLPRASFKITVEGQDSTDDNLTDREDNNHPSVEMMQEFTVQTSNFSAEYGQVGGGLFNFTARSGTNQLHGSAYEYFVNEDLNAGVAFTNDGNGQLKRPKNRQNDYGFTVGGPVWIPKLYNGRNKTFFFFNWEQYRQNNSILGTLTVPTDAMRAGDFSSILTGRVLGTDTLGRPIYENTIYNPATARQVNNQLVEDPFPNNKIPTSQLDPVALAVQKLIPEPTANTLVNNYTPFVPNPKLNTIPGVKVDHNVNDALRLSFYWSQLAYTVVNSADGFPVPLTSRRDDAINSENYRLNGDYTISPTMFLHAGIGWIRDHNPDTSPASVTTYDAVTQLGFKNVLDLGMPHLGFPGTQNFGGVLNSLNGNGFGPTQRNEYWTDKPTAVANLTWVRGNHTFKTGAEYRIDAWIVHTAANVAGVYNFSSNETALPYLGTSTVGGLNIGFPYASFLLGRVDSGQIGNEVINQYRRPSYSMFLQDTWKLSRKLTLDYGLRWDFTQSTHERFYRTSGFAPNTPNPSAGGLLGATAYDGYGPGRCNCNFLPSYPYALGPRLGAAYQVNDKTVVRAGWGLTYGPVTPFNYLGTNTQVVGVGFNVLTFGAPSFGVPVTTLSNGFQYNPADAYAASLNPGIRPIAGQIASPPSPFFDPNGGRPPRINNWNVSVQRALSNNFTIEGAYVGNRAVWLTSGDASNIGIVNNLNALTPQRIASYGLNIRNAADRTLLTSAISSSAVRARGFTAPYAGFPSSATLAQALRPYPQFGTIYTEFSPTGNSWYDALQMKATKRLSHGLEFLDSFTWSHETDRGFDTERGRGAQINDSFNLPANRDLASTSVPFQNVISFTYQIPSVPFISKHGLLNMAFGGWTVGGIFSQASGLPIRVPASTNNLGQILFQGTFVNRNPGVPLFLKDPNCHCFDANTTAFLNPAAWSDPGPGNFGTAAAYYNDYRWQRQYNESANLGKIFRIRESVSFQVRAEFFNLFNRTVLPLGNNVLASSNITIAQTQSISGFGRINTAAVGSPRTGQIVGRFQW